MAWLWGMQLIFKYHSLIWGGGFRHTQLGYNFLHIPLYLHCTSRVLVLYPHHLYRYYSCSNHFLVFYPKDIYSIKLLCICCIPWFGGQNSRSCGSADPSLNINYIYKLLDYSMSIVISTINLSSPIYHEFLFFCFFFSPTFAKKNQAPLEVQVHQPFGLPPRPGAALARTSIEMGWWSQLTTGQMRKSMINQEISYIS